MLPVYAGIFLLAGSILLLEIAFTRTFAIMLWHHLAYMVVSVAMLGFGAAGSILTLRGVAEGPLPARALALLSAGLAGGALLALLAAAQLRVDTLGLLAEPGQLASLAALYALVCLPFLCGGAAVGLLLARLASRVDRLYAADLLGSAAGGAGSVWALARFGSAGAVTFAAGLALLASACFAAAGARGRSRGLAPALAVLGVLLLGSAGGCAPLGLAALDWRVPFAPGKEFARLPQLADPDRIHSATAEVEIGPSQRTIPIVGGDFGRNDYAGVTARFVGQDGTAPSMLFENAAQLASFPFLDDSQAGSAYVAFAAQGGTAPDVLVIGVGGGIDVMIALAAGAQRVTAVEINRAMIEMVTRRYAAYIGDLFRPGAHPLADRISLVHGEGRAFARSTDRRFDVIQLSGVDSFTALSTGAYTLSESYLYTTEAVRDFYARLAEGGYIHYSRFIMQAPKKPRETLRLANIARAALEELGSDDPAAQIAVFQGFDWASTLVKKGRFGSEELAALREFARREGFRGLVFDPSLPRGGLRAEPERFEWRALAAFRNALLQGAYADLALPDVDAAVAALGRAFRARLGSEADAARAALAEAIAPLGGRHPGAASRLSALVDREVAAARRDETAFLSTRQIFADVLRGSPAERERFLRDYPYEIRPATDDTPFFFNYYRWSGAFARRASAPAGAFEVYHPDAPVGHIVLLASLAQITLVAALLILLPLRRLRRRGARVPGRWRVLGYFSALGAGFMFVEIALMQKLVLFLGHPVYAVTVVLSGLLAFAGVGSLLAGRIARVDRRALRLAGAAAVTGVLLAAFVSAAVLPAALGWGFEARVAACLGLLAPLGIVLGLAFPLGIRVLADGAPSLVPWAWAVNAFFSVISSILCIVLAMSIGFANVLLLGALVYAAGFAALASLVGRPLEEP